jgi:serine/threonine-protein kinase ATR
VSQRQASTLQVIDNAQPCALCDADRWEVTLGRVLLHLRRADSAAAGSVLNAEKILLTVQMGPAGLESYQRTHPLMVKLHMLWDLQQLGVAACARGVPLPHSALRAAISRIGSTVVDVESHTQMLALLRALSQLHGAPRVAAETWLRQAAACRAMKHRDAAWVAVLEAERAGVPEAFKLKAKLLWEAARQTEATGVLQWGIEGLEAAAATWGMSGEDLGKLGGRARLKLLAWRVEQGQGDTAALQTQFQDIVRARPDDDKAHMEFAVFLRKVYEDLRNRCVAACML